jgi:hypothetical protein
MISDLLHLRVEDGEANDANVERSHASGGGSVGREGLPFGSLIRGTLG